MKNKVITGIISAAMVMSMSGMMVFADQTPSWTLDVQNPNNEAAESNEDSEELQFEEPIIELADSETTDQEDVHSNTDDNVNLIHISEPVPDSIGYDIGLNEAGGIAINEENFPDAVFRGYVAYEYDRNEDGYLNNAEIAYVTEMSIVQRNVTSFKGIEIFSNLTELNCSGNNITELDLSGCASLKELVCIRDNLSSLNLTGCTSLEQLSCFDNNLTSLDLSTNTALKMISCYDNNLSIIDISHNPSLVEINSENPFISKRKDKTDKVYGTAISEEECESLACQGVPAIAFVDAATKESVFMCLNVMITDFDTVIVNNAAPEATPVPTTVPTAAPTATPTAAPTTKPSTTRTTTTSKKPSATPAPKSDMVSFAERLYTKALGRNYDKAGRNYWVAQMKAGMTGTEVAMRFFFSDEYVNAHHSNADFVATLYRTFMNREYDQAGFDFWMNEIANGCSRENILARFAACPEFANICANAGIAR